METEQTGDGRILLLRREGKILTLLYKGGRLLRAEAYAPLSDILGNIYIGKVKNVVQSIQAAFVEFIPGRLCFLPFKELHKPILTNRVYDGRLIAGDEIVLQICTEAQKTKEPGAECVLSFTGKYVVLTYGKKQTGYSPRLSEQKKGALRIYAEEHPFFAEVKKEYGLIFRTNAEHLQDFSELEAELMLLKEEADSLRQTAPYRTCFSLLRQTPPAYLKNLQDYCAADYAKIMTDDAVIYEETKDWMRAHMAADIQKLSFYEDKLLPLSKLYSVEARLAEALDKRVWLKSGAYLVIERTEALTSIDVNSGKYTGKKQSTEAYFNINMEAAREIARQLLLRNLSGIIMIDFINMKSKEQEKALLAGLRKAFACDSQKTTVVDMTPLGLVEVTRKKVRKPLCEQLRS